MISHEAILERVLTRISVELVDSIKDTISEVVHKELSSTVTKAMVESEFYRYLNEEMRSGLKGIYQEISSASSAEEEVKPDTPFDSSGTQKLFNDATLQLNEIMQTVLEATEAIFELAEALQEQQEEAGEIIATLPVDSSEAVKLARLDVLNSNLGEALTHIITALSFQDLTGQRLKKVVKALASIQEKVFDLYVSTGLMINHSNEVTEKGFAFVKEETIKKVKGLKIKGSELKGPTKDASQVEVDDLLSSLGL